MPMLSPVGLCDWRGHLSLTLCTQSTILMSSAVKSSPRDCSSFWILLLKCAPVSSVFCFCFFFLLWLHRNIPGRVNMNRQDHDHGNCALGYTSECSAHFPGVLFQTGMSFQKCPIGDKNPNIVFHLRKKCCMWFANDRKR